MGDLTASERNRVRSLYQEVMCDCPREDYSRTLANCPDPCAEAQKRIIRAMVEENHSDADIFQTMLSRVGQNRRVIAAAGSAFGAGAYVLPFVFLGGALVVVGFVLRGWRRQGLLDRQRRLQQGAVLSGNEVERVEEELAELD